MASGTVKLAGLEPSVRAAARWALDWADFYDVPVTVTSGFRSLSEQKRLRDAWERGESRFPANRPGDSSHNFGLAFDSVTEPWAQEWWNHVRTLAGFEVLPNDLIHAQAPNWRQFV